MDLLESVLDFSNRNLDEIIIIVILSIFSGYFLGIITSRAPVRYIARLFRPVFAPFRWIGKLFRQFRVFSVTVTRGGQATDTSGETELPDVLSHKPEIEKQLLIAWFEYTKRSKSDNAAVEIRFLTEKEIKKAEAEKKQFDTEIIENTLDQEGFFHHIKHPKDYAPNSLLDSNDPEEIKMAAVNADKYFNGSVNITSNENALYEEVDGACIIEMFGKADYPAYLLIDTARKVINRNALKVVSLYTLVLSAVIISLIVSTAYLNGPGLYALLAGISVSGCILMFGVFYAGYKVKQNLCLRDMREFIIHYFSLISNRYMDMRGRAKGVPTGKDKSPDTLATEAQTWNKIMIWLAFRTFFVETFLRNEIYQVNRNIKYYGMLAYTTLCLILITTISFLVLTDYPLLDGLTTEQMIFVIGAFFVPVLFYVGFLKQGVISGNLEQLSWRGFNTLQLGSVIDEIVGEYAGEIGNWWELRKDRQ